MQSSRGGVYCFPGFGERGGGARVSLGGEHIWDKREAHGGHGAGASMEADVLVLLPVPAGHCALHAGALGANRVQFDAGFRGGDGPVHWLRLHAPAHHGYSALL